jgi:GH35 family endo-1,4-beta-xylanase
MSPDSIDQSVTPCWPRRSPVAASAAPFRREAHSPAAGRAARWPALLLAAALLAASAARGQPYTPPGPPLALGKAKFLGCAHTPSSTGSTNFDKYWNQVTPENAGKWGSVESRRDVMNWAELDASYTFARQHGFTFKMHTLVWGAQQPSWITALPPADQLREIEQWFAAVAARYPDLDAIDVVNEPIHQAPDGVNANTANYVAALGGAGQTGWDWVLTSFRLARRYFPNSRLVLNEYGVTGNAATAATYVRIINLLKAEHLIDAVGIQAHAFETRASTADIRRDLDAIAATGVPILISEFDVDGPTDQTQLDEYQRLFPLFWEHPAVAGVTLWGYRPGMWRTTQQAYLALENGAERPALQWLATYLQNHRPVVNPDQRFTVNRDATADTALGYVLASDADGNQAVSSWSIVGGTGANAFSIDGTGQLRVRDAAALPGAPGELSLLVTAGDGRDNSDPATLTVQLLPAATRRSRLVNIATRAYCGTDNAIAIGGFVIEGGPRRVLVRAVGPSLAGRGIPAAETLANPEVAVRDALHGSVVVASNDDWTTADNVSEIGPVGAAIGAAPLENSDRTSAVVLTTLPAGVYTCTVTGHNATAGIVLVEVYDAEPDNPSSRLVNIATRAYANTGNGVAIGGFVIAGDARKQVLLRAVGTTLTKFGLAETTLLPDANITVYDARRAGSVVIARNDNWADNSNQAAMTPVSARIGASPLVRADYRTAGVLLTLPPGPYTFMVNGTATNATGIVLVEVYDAD